MSKYEKWFLKNQEKFEYPRLANKSAKMAWVESEKVMIKKIEDLGCGDVDSLCVEWEETRNMTKVLERLVLILKVDESKC